MKTFIENKKYLVSEKGEVYSTQLLGNQSQARLRKLKPSKHKSGYLYVTLSDNEGNKRKIFVHRIVALTYIDNPQNKEFVNHIDGDKMNNNVDNLEWVTRRENMIHARDVLGCNFNKNIKPIYQYDLNGNFIKRYESLKEVSERFKRDMSDIRRVCNGDRGRLYAYNYIWSYEDKKYTYVDLEKYIAAISGGDCRKAINIVELLFDICPHYKKTYFLNISDCHELGQRSASRYDRDGDMHYDILSAFQKSIRGSDPDAAVFYLAKLVEADDIISPCRRLLVIASEDIGLAYPQAISIVKSCVDAAMQLGYPEARIPLAEATIFLATCPKSNSAINAIDAALMDVKEGKGVEIPTHLLDSHYAGSKDLGHGLNYVYPHNYPSHWIYQQYLPSDIKTKKYYSYCDNKIEQATKSYWEQITKKVNK